MRWRRMFCQRMGGMPRFVRGPGGMRKSRTINCEEERGEERGNRGGGEVTLWGGEWQHTVYTR
jgi:hypothetical protein